MESDNDDLFEFLSQLKDDEFEGYPGINYENGRKISDRTSGSQGQKRRACLEGYAGIRDPG